MKKIAIFIKQNRTFVAILVICLVLLILFVSIAIKSGSWPGLEASGQILSALAGAVVAAMITLFLLLGQTSSEEKKERNSKVFEEKLKIYQDFLETLNKVLEDGEISPEEALKLKFKISMITLHTDSQRINIISDSIKNIFLSVNKKQGKSITDQVELNQLYQIVNQFRLEIYDDNKGLNKEDLNKTLENFAIIDESCKPGSKPIEIKEDKGVSAIRPISEYCEELVESFAKIGWELKNDETHPIIIDKEGIRIKVESDGNWYFSVVTDDPPYNYNFRRELYKHLRRTFSGYFNTNASWGWYNYLKDEYKGKSLEAFIDGMTVDKEFKEYTINVLQKLVESMDKIPIIGSVVNNQLKTTSSKWQSWPYLDEGLCLANDFGSEDGHPFIDFWVRPDGYEVVLSVRSGEEHLGDYLSKIGFNDNRKNMTDRWREQFQSLDEAIARTNDIIKRIEQADTDN